MLVLKDIKSYITTFIKEKEKLMCKIAFLSLSKSNKCELVIMPEVAYQTVIKDVIYKALIS